MTLENIDASSNLLTVFPDFTDQTNLTVLDLSFNNIGSFNYHKLPTSIVELDLTWNHISNLPSLDTFVNLQKIVLLHNRIHVLHALPNTLVYIQLQQNNMTKFFDTSNLSALTRLNLRSNFIADSDSKLFSTSLLDLDISDNLLTKVPADVTNLSNLKELSIGSNQITSIDSFVFPSSITKLLVSNTSIESISQMKFHNDISNIEVASFFLNPLKTISDDAFTHMRNMTKVQIDLCKLTRLPAALKSCPNLATANLFNNPDMLCTCLEASPLLPLYNRTNPVNIYGYCNGNFAINNFMTTLAKDCLPPHSSK